MVTEIIKEENKKLEAPQEVFDNYKDFLEIFLNDPNLIYGDSSCSIINTFTIDGKILFVEFKISELKKNE